MNINGMVSKKLITRKDPDPSEISRLTRSSNDRLNAAEQRLPDDPVRCFAQTYDAIYEGCCAFMQRLGYWTVEEFDHRTVLNFCRSSLSPKYVRILDAFELAERRRHDEMYDGRFSIVEEEAKEMLRKARVLVRRLALT